MEWLGYRLGSWHVVGDSHVGAIQCAATMGLINAPCRFTVVNGATAVGLRNPNALTDAVGAFKSALLPPAERAIPLIHLGEVDCGFVIWYRAKKYGESVASQLKQSIAAYFQFVDDLLATGFKQVVISGATLPTILDGQSWSEIANARKEVSATLRDRTDLTLHYNALLMAGAYDRGMPFIDITDQVLCPESRVVKDEFRHPNKLDHHLHPERAGLLWAQKMNALQIEL